MYVCMYVYQYKSIGTVSNNNGMKGEVVGSSPTGCVCKLLIKIKNVCICKLQNVEISIFGAVHTYI